jgi:hypothetical protein
MIEAPIHAAKNGRSRSHIVRESLNLHQSTDKTASATGHDALM